MPQLLSSSTADEYRAVVVDAVERVAASLRRTTQPFSGASREHLQSLVDGVDLDAPGAGTAAALAELSDYYLPNAIWFHDPAYVAHLNCPVVLPAVAAEAVIAAVNPSVDTYDQSTIGTLMERRLVTWTAERIGYADGDGVFTSGGSQSNLQALLLAREAAVAAAQRVDPGALRSAILPRLVVVATASSHFSVQKSALLLGLADDAVVTVPTDARGRMRPEALAPTFAALRDGGRLPMCVVATAGTTDRGCIDPLVPIADACDDAEVWLHVDAAYGCGLLVSLQHRALIDGIERSRSVTVDFHKSFFQPVSSSAILVRDAADLAAITWHADYLNPLELNPLESGDPNQVDKSLQTTRRFDALKLWTTLRAVGAQGLGAMFDDVLALAQAVQVLVVADPELELVGETQLSTVLFRYRSASMTAEQADALVPLIRRVLFESGRALVAKTVIDGRPTLKLTLLNPETTPEQVAAVLELVKNAGSALHERDDLLAIEAVQR
ncbi:pyridoxal-dependent decarboxylase [Microbacteriaceae bacterium VKM Ac-2854]|nr:pyridoxal-dependent decarboxylase [Microbacteriaceae bacterium VKM Ac-2854]